MSATAATPSWGSDVDAYYGASIEQSFFDLAARRHQMPSVMDPPLPEVDLCRCPGGPESENSCIDSRPSHDVLLCHACSLYCYSVEDGKQILFIDQFGSVLEPSSEVESTSDKPEEN